MKHCILTGPRATSVPSHRLSLQWFIHKELHCFIAGRCEGDIMLLCQVTMIFAARDCIALCCIVWAQQASIKIYSVKTQTPFYAVVCAPRPSSSCSHPPPLLLNQVFEQIQQCRLRPGVLSASLHTPRVNSALPGPTSG